MRRAERQITDPERIEEILRGADVCHIALLDGGEPYVLPVNFGYTLLEGELKLYFHGARAGRKYALIQQNNRIGFSICGHAEAYSETPEDPAQACKWTACYSSVVGHGAVEEITAPAEKTAALDRLMAQATGMPEGFSYSEASVLRTGVFVITADAFSAKSNMA